MDKKEGEGDASMEDAASLANGAATVDPTSATQAEGNDSNEGVDNSNDAKTLPATAEIVDTSDATPTKPPPAAAPAEVETVNVTEKTTGIAASASTIGGPAAAAGVVTAPSVHLAGFADATPSPSAKKGAPFWKVKATADPEKTEDTDSADDELATQPENAEVEDAVDENMEDVEETVEIAEDGNEAIQEEEGEIVVTPAAEAIMDAISTGAIVTATLTENVQEEDEEGDDENQNQEGNEHRDDDDAMDDMDPVDRAAREAAASMNREALYSTYESNFTTLRGERDDLRRQLAMKDEDSAKQEEEYAKLKLQVVSLKEQMDRKDQEMDSMRGVAQTERHAKEETQRKLSCSQERTDRVEKEADGLRSEISRLTKSNEEYNSLLNSMSTQHSKSSSEAIPLRLQVKRLEQELAAVTTHSNYLDGELASKIEAIGSLKLSHSSELRSLRGELDQVKLSLEQRERDLDSARTSANCNSLEMDRLQKKLYDREMEYASQKELLEQDLNQERELVSLKEQRMLLAEDQKAALVREVEDLKTLAKEAAEEATLQSEDFHSRLNKGIEAAVMEVKETEVQKREELQERLEVAEEAKLRLEEDVLGRSTPKRRRIEGAEVPLAIANDDTSMLLDESSGDPLSLTDLYTRLAATEDELRSSRHSNQKLNILIDRIRRDVAAKTPILHQKQLELEGALDELDVANERLDYARREVSDIRADNGDLELKCRDMEQECSELRRENVDLATQVQSLLQRRSAGSGDLVTFDDVASLQGQNQKLLRDHHAMSDKINELETKIKENPDEIELKQLRSEVVGLREEREKQSKLVVGIVHQRDLYRALVAKNDAPLLGGAEQLVLADAKAEQLPLIEARNHELSEELATLKAENSCAKHETEALNGRLARVDAHANELTTSNERLRGELTTTKSTAARLEIDVSHYQGKCERLETSLEMLKAENESESRRKGQLEELLGKTQSHLEAVRGELAHKEQQYQQVSSKTRLLEVQLQTSTANEKRMESDAASLRSEIARQETLLSSVQRIEASLMAKSEGELENLQEEVQRLREAKSDDETKHREAVLRLDGKIADLEDAKKKLAEQRAEESMSAAKAKLEVEKLEKELMELTLKLKTSEKELMAAKVKLGDVTIDTSVEEALEAKVASLTTELELVKSDLATAQKRISDYQIIAKTAEEQVTELTAASTKYKDDTTASLEKLRKSEQSQREAVAELTNDLMSHRDEKEKAVSQLKAKVDSLAVQLAGAKKDSVKATSRMESVTSEAKRYQLDATNANTNYSRELALHSEARTALREARSSLESERRLRLTAEAELASAMTDVKAQHAEWETSKTKLEESLDEATSRLDNVRRQNNLLHDQMASLSSTVEKFQSNKALQLVGVESSADAGVNGDGDKVGAGLPGKKQLSDLRELLRFKQSECTMLEADLASAKRASERERTAAELAKRSLEEARSELKTLRKSDKAGGGAATEEEAGALRSKLKSAEEQLLLIRESNTMLREESHKVSKKLSEMQSNFNKLKSSTAPQTVRLKDMAVEMATLSAEKDSLAREVDAWKNRVHSLVSKFNQIDPEEHAQAVASVEKLKEECASLKTKKEQADANATKAKGLVTRLNNEISSQKASIEMFKASLEKVKKEKEESTNSNKIFNKKIADAQAATKKAESGLKSSRTEVESLNARISNFRKMMQKMQTGLKDAKQAEAKAKASEESLQKEIAVLKQRVHAANVASGATAKAAASAEAATTETVSTTERQQAADVAEKETAPASVAEKPGAQLQPVKEMKETQEKASSTAADSSGKSFAAVQPEAKNAEGVAEKTADASAENTVTDATVLAKKKGKGKKRKAISPKKNAAAATSATEGTKAPPQKKAATQPVTAKKEAPPVTESQPVVKVARATARSVVAKKISDASVAAESAKALNSLAKGTQKKSMTAKKDATSSTVLASKKEEDMKLKMLKKRMAAAMAKKQEAEKQQLAAKKKRQAESSTSLDSLEGSDKSSKGSNSSNTSKSGSQIAIATTPKERLAPVQEQGGSNEAKVCTDEIPSALGSEKDTAPEVSTPNPVFGSSATLATPPMTFGVSAAKSMQSEPNCPKPSFFGASASTPPSFGGAAASTSTFGGGAKPPGELKSGGNSGAFLNLMPPGKLGATPGKFVFGKSANITLTVPSSSPMTAPPKSNFGSFGQTAPKFGTTPFGGGFGGSTAAAFGTSPFGGGDESKKRPLSSASAEEGGEPDAKQSRKEEGEIADDVQKPEGSATESSKLKNDAAKEA